MERERITREVDAMNDQTKMVQAELKRLQENQTREANMTKCLTKGKSQCLRNFLLLCVLPAHMYLVCL